MIWGSIFGGFSDRDPPLRAEKQCKLHSPTFIYLTMNNVLCLAAAVFLTSLLTGCGSSGPSQETLDERQLRPLVILFGQYIGTHNGRCPANEQDFRSFAESRKDILTRFNTDLEGVFKSKRDQQPYKVYYGLPAGYDGLIAHEQQGANGKRLVGYSIGQVNVVSDEEFQKLKLPGK